MDQIKGTKSGDAFLSSVTTDPMVPIQPIDELGLNNWSLGWKSDDESVFVAWTLTLRASTSLLHLPYIRLARHLHTYLAQQT